MIKLVMAMCIIVTVSMSAGLSVYSYGTDAVANKEKTQYITLAELSYMYTGELTHWHDGSRVYVFVKKLSDYQQKSMIINILGVSISRYKEIVADSDNIVIVNKNKLIKEMILKKGALGIIDHDKLILCTEKGLVEVEIIE